MAVKKANKAVEKEVEVQVNPSVEETPEVPVDETPETGADETSVDVEAGVEKTAQNDVEVQQEVEIPEVPVEDETPDVQVDTEAKVDTSNKPEEKVKIRMRVDHKCCIAMERYDLVAGKTYVVPRNVKNILNKAGLLAPL